MEENILLLDEDSEGDPLLLGLADPVMQLEDVGDTVEDALGGKDEDTDTLLEIETIIVTEGDTDEL